MILLKKAENSPRIIDKEDHIFILQVSFFLRNIRPRIIQQMQILGFLHHVQSNYHGEEFFSFKFNIPINSYLYLNLFFLIMFTLETLKSKSKSLVLLAPYFVTIKTHREPLVNPIILCTLGINFTLLDIIRY